MTGCRWSSARGRWEVEARPGVSKEPCGHTHHGGPPSPAVELDQAGTLAARIALRSAAVSAAEDRMFVAGEIRDYLGDVTSLSYGTRNRIAWGLTERLAEQMLAASREATTCFIQNHVGRLEAAEHGRRHDVGGPGYGAGMTESSAEPTTEVSVETPAKDETTVEVSADAVGQTTEPAPAETTHVETTVEKS